MTFVLQARAGQSRRQVQVLVSYFGSVPPQDYASGSTGILVIVEVAAARIWPERTVVEVGAVLAFVAAIESCWRLKSSHLG